MTRRRRAARQSRGAGVASGRRSLVAFWPQRSRLQQPVRIACARLMVPQGASYFEVSERFSFLTGEQHKILQRVAVLLLLAVLLHCCYQRSTRAHALNLLESEPPLFLLSGLASTAGVAGGSSCWIVAAALPLLSPGFQFFMPAACRLRSCSS